MEIDYFLIENLEINYFEMIYQLEFIPEILVGENKWQQVSAARFWKHIPFGNKFFLDIFRIVPVIEPMPLPETWAVQNVLLNSLTHVTQAPKGLDGIQKICF